MVRILHTLARDLATSTIHQIDLLRKGLAQHGIENSICSLESNSIQRQRLSTLGERSWFCPCRSTLDPIVMHRYGNSLRQLRPDVIHYWGSRIEAVVLLSNRLYGRRPLVVSANPTRMLRWLDGSAQLIVGTKQAKRKLYLSRIPSEQIVVIPAGAKFTNEPNSIRSLHSELGLPGEVKFVAAMGDLLTEHRFKDVIWALDLLRVIHPKVHLVIFGEGRAEPQLRVAQRDIVSSDFVHFWGAEPDAQALIQQCFCFWHASPGDNSTILQAMAAGVPVVAVKGQSTIEAAAREAIVRDGETGFLVPFGDCAEIARKTNLLLKYPERAAQVQRTARQYVGEQHTPESMVQAFVNVYERAMSCSVKAA